MGGNQEYIIIQTVVLLASWFFTAYKMFSQFATKKDLELLEERLMERLEDKIELSTSKMHRRINGLYRYHRTHKKTLRNQSK